MYVAGPCWRREVLRSEQASPRSAGVEQDPIVCAALVICTDEIARNQPHPLSAVWMRECRRDRTQASEARLTATSGWLCLTDEPAPDDLRAVVDDLTTDERAHAMDELPWMAGAGGSGQTGLHRWVQEMPHPEQPAATPHDDPRAARS
jgi:hypothetical protein